ncbi:hypothetical protein TREES_T100010944 [Tupaia chinensis]|uniref:Uncharacterized protein n=1 Tax=Tupaia chinensis TaxID=246437 RepID=L9JIV2_TUPCH|nr:hypothetical protein TREES_T100010944 [Tupaia chinensis]
MRSTYANMPPEYNPRPTGCSRGCSVTCNHQNERRFPEEKGKKTKSSVENEGERRGKFQALLRLHRLDEHCPDVVRSSTAKDNATPGEFRQSNWNHLLNDCQPHWTCSGLQPGFATSEEARSLDRDAQADMESKRSSVFCDLNSKHIAKFKTQPVDAGSNSREITSQLISLDFRPLHNRYPKLTAHSHPAVSAEHVQGPHGRSARHVAHGPSTTHTEPLQVAAYTLPHLGHGPRFAALCDRRRPPGHSRCTPPHSALCSPVSPCLPTLSHREVRPGRSKPRCFVPRHTPSSQTSTGAQQTARVD